MPQSFAPLIDEKTKILIIGTMPGIASLDAAEYYAHPRNAFWKIISETFNNGQMFQSYEKKKNCLLAHGIGLWDNLQYCERNGSLDSNIRKEVPNDFETLLAQYPKVQKLLFNGQKSFQFFKKYHSGLLEELEYYTLPSTSPANATLCFDTKLAEWQKFI